jgi:hypothetical protein
MCCIFGVRWTALTSSSAPPPVLQGRWYCACDESRWSEAQCMQREGSAFVCCGWTQQVQGGVQCYCNGQLWSGKHREWLNEIKHIHTHIHKSTGLQRHTEIIMALCCGKCVAHPIMDKRRRNSCLLQEIHGLPTTVVTTRPYAHTMQ